jgi:membrane protein
MDMTKVHMTQSFGKRPNNYSIFKRIANLTLVIVAAAICVNLWLLNTSQSKNWHDKQSTQLGRALAAYAANVIAPSLQQQDEVKIAAQINLLAADNHVAGVSVYNQRGEFVDSNEPNSSVLASFLLDDDIPLVFIQEITLGDNTLGYLRLLINEQQVMQYHAEYQQQLNNQLIVLMLLAGFIGMLIARSYYKIRFRHYIKPAKK